jgi:CsoR family transcriptional regulator, copper-sensing transcriptional repressor
VTTTDHAAPDRADRADRADRLAARLSGPVLVAALASIPATFLTLFDGAYATVGSTLNALSGAVLIAETVVLLALADDKRAWLRRNRWLVGLSVLLVPAVIFAVGPVQLLRLLRVVGALRIVRVRRIVKAGRIIRERHGLTSRWSRFVTGTLVTATAAFVALVLADPTSESRRLLDDAVGRVGPFGVLLAGSILAAATFVVRSNRRG